MAKKQTQQQGYTAPQPPPSSSNRAVSQFVLHVGLPKTGSKSLQMAFLTSEDIYYLQTPGSGHIHSRAFSNLCGVGWNVLKTQPQRAEYREKMLADLHASPSRLRVASDEPLSQVQRVNWEAMASLLDKIPGKIRVILVIRPFFSWLESLLILFAKNGNLDFRHIRPGRMENLNRYPLNFLKIHNAYAALVEHLGSRAQLDVIPYSRAMLDTIAQNLDHKLPSFDDANFAHRSLSPYVALAQYAQGKNLVDKMPSRTGKFLGLREGEALHKKNAEWMHDLASALDWRPALIDDYERFTKSAETFSYVRFGKRHFVVE